MFTLNSLHALLPCLPRLVAVALHADGTEQDSRCAGLRYYLQRVSFLMSHACSLPSCFAQWFWWLSSIAYAAVTACTVQAVVACRVFVAGAPEWPMQPASVGQELLCCAALAASAGDVL